MEKVNQVLAFVFYLVWIPLGLLLITGILFLLISNPLGRLMEQFPGGGGGPSGYGPPSGMEGQQPGNFGPNGNFDQPGGFDPGEGR